MSIEAGRLARVLVAVAVAVVGAACESAEKGTAEPLRMFVAASTEAVMSDVVAAYAGRPGATTPRISAASSATLARQIAEGAPADLFVSASRQWLDYLDERTLLVADSRRTLFGNRLAIVAPTTSTLEVEVDRGFPFAQAFTGRLSTGDSGSVPLGMYAREALERLGWWVALEDRIAAAPDAMAALTLVARGECEVGIVYLTEARASAEVRIVALIPTELHTPIEYGAAIVAGRDSEESRRLLDFLAISRRAHAIYRRHGFVPPGGRNGMLAHASGAGS